MRASSRYCYSLTQLCRAEVVAEVDTMNPFPHNQPTQRPFARGHAIQHIFCEVNELGTCSNEELTRECSCCSHDNVGVMYLSCYQGHMRSTVHLGTIMLAIYLMSQEWYS